MPKLPITGFLRQRKKRPISSSLLKAARLLNIGEGEQIVVTYTSATDKMKVLSAFIREGLENGDLVDYTYPDEESETVRAELEKHGINVKKYEREGILILRSLTEQFMLNGVLDFQKAVNNGLNWWAEAKRKGYHHLRDIEDVGDFSFSNGQWQKYVTGYWLDPRWSDPNVSEWVKSKEPGKVVYDPFIIDLIAINVERMIKTQVTELLKAFSGGKVLQKKFYIDLLENMDCFSRSIGLNHERLLGRKILMEFDPFSDYEKVVEDFVKESMANVEPIFVFTSRNSAVHKCLVKRSAVKFFLTSISASTPKAVSENEVLLPATNAPLILDAIDKVLETYVKSNVCFVFDIISELLTLIEPKKTFSFLHSALDMLFSEKVTGLFLLNTTAHEPEAISRTREFFRNLLTHDKDGLKVVKVF